MNQHEEAIKRVEGIAACFEAASRLYAPYLPGDPAPKDCARDAADLRILLELVKRGEADTQRLDWMEGRGYVAAHPNRHFEGRTAMFGWSKERWAGAPLRAAIDAARHPSTPDGERSEA